LGKTKKRPLLPILLIIAGILVLVTALVSIFLFSGQDQSSASNNTDQDIPFSQISRVDVETVKSALESEQAVVVDVRDKVYYDEGHIPGAVSIPLGEIESRLGELDQSDWIITYCT